MENKISVLIVEDDALIAEILKLRLEDFDFDVCAVCYDYESAEAAIAEKSFDIALLDINLGSHHHHSGLDLARIINTSKKVPFVFTTAFSDKQTITTAAQLNPSGYLVKPVNGPSVFAAIQTAISNFKQQTKAAPPQEVEEPLFFYNKVGTQLVKVNWSDVYALTATKNYVKLLTAKHPSGYLMRLSLQQALQSFIPATLRHEYVQINRSTALQASIIKSIKDDSVVTDYGEFETTRVFLEYLGEVRKKAGPYTGK